MRFRAVTVWVWLVGCGLGCSGDEGNSDAESPACDAFEGTCDPGCGEVGGTGYRHAAGTCSEAMNLVCVPGHFEIPGFGESSYWYREDGGGGTLAVHLIGIPAEGPPAWTRCECDVPACTCVPNFAAACAADSTTEGTSHGADPTDGSST